MSSISFVRSGSDAAPETGPAVPEQNAVPCDEQGEPTPGVSPGCEVASPGFYGAEEINWTEVRFPRLNLVQNVGNLKDTFEPGQIVVDGESVLYTPPNILKKVAGDPPLIATCAGVSPRSYVEKLPGGAKGRIFHDERDVPKNGGTLVWAESRENKKIESALPLFQREATALLVIEKPAGFQDTDDLLFQYDFNGTRFLIATWKMQASAYNAGISTLLSARHHGLLKDSYTAVSYTLSVKTQTNAGNAYFVPALKPGRRNSVDFQKFLAETLGGGSAA